MNKKATTWGWEVIGKIILVLIVILVVIFIIGLLAGKNLELLDQIKSIFG